MIAKRAYPHKSENERRVVVSFSVSGPMLESLRKRLEMHMHTQPTKREVQAFARGKAYEAIEAYLAEPFVPEKDEMETIQYIDLSEGAQKVIDSFPEEQSLTFFARPRGKGYEVKPVEDSKLDLLGAQGGMGEGWMQVVFSQREVSLPGKDETKW